MADKDAKDAKDISSVLVSVAAIVGLVVLNIFSHDVPAHVNYGLIGAALGASIEDIRNWVSGRKP